MNSVYKVKSDFFEVKDVDMGSRTLIQQFTKYNVVDSDNDIGRKGMFTKSWNENFGRIKHVLNHDMTKPLGKPEKLWDDENGAYLKSKIGTHALGDDFIKMADSGLITEASYGYKTMKENKLKDGTNELLEVKHWETSSLTTWGANQYTPILSLTKSMTKEEQVDKISIRIKAVEKFCKNTTATDETIDLLLLELKQLQQLFIDLTKSTEAAVEALEPVEQGNESLLIELKSINQIFN
jgi:HK97 family phage prohead protease